MKSTISLVVLLVSITAFSADISMRWTNGDNPTATSSWQTIVYISTSPTVSPTNYVSTFTVSWPQNTATVTNLAAGTRYYFCVSHTDLEDISDPSNTVNSKTKINPPKNNAVIP